MTDERKSQHTDEQVEDLDVGTEEAEDVTGGKSGKGPKPGQEYVYMAGWLPAMGDPRLFLRVPDVLPAWIAYTSRVNGLPSAATEETLDAVKQQTRWLLEGERLSGKDALAAMAEAGVDVTKPSAIGRFVNERR